MFDVVEYLQSKNIQLKPAGVFDVHTTCWYCGEDPAKRGRLYINIDPNMDPLGLFMCHRCGETGAINKLRKHFGDKPLGLEEKQQANQKSSQILQAATAFYHEALSEEENLHALKWWRNERGLTIETIQKFKLGYAVDGLEAHLKEKGFSVDEIKATGLIDAHGREFLKGCVTIPYLSNGQAQLLRGRQLVESSQKYLTPTGQKGKLFNAEITFGDLNEVCLCEGEIDAISLCQNGIPAVAMSGAVAYQAAWNSYFEDIKKVHLVFDPDEAGRRGAEKVQALLGAKARVVELPQSDPKLDPNQWFLQGRTADEFLELLGKVKHPLLITIDEAYQQWDEMAEVEGLKLGIEALDFRLQGLKPSQVLTYIAKSGVGKTLFMLNLFYRMSMVRDDVKILFISLEQTRGEWFERARRIHRFYNPTHSDKQALDYFRGRLALVDKNRISEDDLLAVIEAYKDSYGRPDVVAIDYLGYWAWAYPGEPYQRTSAAIMALKSIAKDANTVIIAPHQVNRGGKYGEELEADDARDSGVISETSDFMLSLWSEDNRKGVKEDTKTGRVSCRILKSRHGGQGTTVQLQFAPLSLAMVPVTDDEDAWRAKRELDWNNAKDTFDIAIYRHATEDDRLVIPPQDIAAWRSSLIQEA